ncbi:ABC transporter permease [Methanobrevibacter sp. OttesenSCG-928-K11]|nr:ABC transporter permease [Methanobrevibacter sp. OttesenSCG-928-K11]MDL2270322.1 ABC transporter permease [Methanobrevibacter sp. OttesenSCG-928-I08]
MNSRRLLPLILPIAIIIVWHLITDVFQLVTPYVLPSPTDVLMAASELIGSGRLLSDSIDTLFKVFGGMFFASIVAIPLGIILGWSKTLEDMASFVISILRPIPPVAWIPFSILWFGIGTVPAIFIIFMGCVFPILVYTIDGVKRTDKVLIEAAQTLGAGDFDVLSKIILPSSVPYIVSGLKVGVGIALMCTISAEMIGSSSGLGYLILTATNLFDTGTTVVGMLTIGIIGLILDYIFGKAQDRIFW